jgi:hypothetical protein
VAAQMKEERPSGHPAKVLVEGDLGDHRRNG